MTNEEYHAIQEHLGKNKKDTYIYTGQDIQYMLNKKVKIYTFFPNSGSSCDAMIQLVNGTGGQCEWISKEEVVNNLIKTI